jgi:ABC-type lipoprotein export system ATPase subunit
MERTSQGALWRVWDFHCHTPASYQWSGSPNLRGAVGEARQAIVKETVLSLKNAEPDVFVIMDYWTFDGYLAVTDYVHQHPEELPSKQVFPGIELRVESSLDKRLNVHLVIDPTVERQVLQDVLNDLKVSLCAGERGLSEACLIQYARELGAEKLSRHGFDAARVAQDPEYALTVGWQTAMVTPHSLSKALETLGSRGRLLMPWDTYGGLKDIKPGPHYAEVRRHMTAASIFECKDQGNRDAFHGVRSADNEKYFDAFWKSLGSRPRLCVRGTDAHKHADYGVFPNGMKTWIKAEPTFQGMCHAIKEPSFRSYIGDIPPKLAQVRDSGRLFMKRLTVTRKPSATLAEAWFDGTDIELNPDLVAIIGNKGSGKSGLAEVLALAGNSKAHEYFTFLIDDRFKSGATQRAAAFEAALTWCNDDVGQVSLDHRFIEDQPERVKYISQDYFEMLCNDHINGQSDQFSAEIRQVLFSHLDSADKGSHAGLDEYLADKERPALERIGAHRVALGDINRALADLEQQASAGHLNELRERLASKELELGDHNAKMPAEVQKPEAGSDDLSPEGERLKVIAEELAVRESARQNSEATRRMLASRRTKVASVAQRLDDHVALATQLGAALEKELAEVAVDIRPLISVEVKSGLLREVAAEDALHIEQLVNQELELQVVRQTLEAEQKQLQEKLDGPSKAYQEYLTARATWDRIRAQIVGTEGQTDTVAFYKARIADLSTLPDRCRVLQEKQDEIVRQIHQELVSIAESRRPLFDGVEEIVRSVPGVAEELKVAFQSALFFDRSAFFESFFGQVKQNTGGFRGEMEGASKLNGLIRSIDFNDTESVVAGLRSIRNEITKNGETDLPLIPILRAKVEVEDFYDSLFDLRNLEAKFSLSLAGTSIQQMSPGQRGALLLIFYLLVDTDPTPLILDQPEENLDNQTVYSMLVPIIQRAKETRQIVMVTHNANLAVCCDAEQIIHAEFDRADGFALRYQSGAIESMELNRSVLNVLEGTTPAFENRQAKYLH